MRDGRIAMQLPRRIALSLALVALAWATPVQAASERCIAVSNGSGQMAWVGIRNGKCATEANGFTDLCGHGGLDDGDAASFCPRPELGLGKRFGVTFIQGGRRIPCDDIELFGHAHLAADGACKTR